MIGAGLNDFYNVHDAAVNADGLFEAALIPLREQVLYPKMVVPLFVERERSLAAINAAYEHQVTAIGVAQINAEITEPDAANLYKIGTEVAFGRPMRIPEGLVSVLAQGRRRVEIVEYIATEPFIRVRVRPIVERTVRSRESEALMRAVLTLFEKCVQLNRTLPEEAYTYALNVDRPGWLADLIASTLDLKLEDRQRLLETIPPAERLRRVSVLLRRELDVLELEEQIQNQVHQEVDHSQREMLLREQMRVIQGELGETDPLQQEIAELREKIDEAHMPVEVRDKALKELNRLLLMPQMAPEIGIVRGYLDWLVDLPWSKVSEDHFDLTRAEKVLNEAHYGLKKAKDRIIEQIAVRKLAPDDVRSPILCFVGPPGTGKTSLGQSIADALGREFVRVSLGGVRDEAEIRGHRRTYIGAMPGRIIQTMRHAGTINPVFMLDEIDKLGADFRGDPAAALLEVLDPEQNNSYTDHYLDVPYDLSKVMFVTTANTLATLPDALLDRLEIIEFPGYTEEEKLAIAHRFLVPRQLKRHGLAERGLVFDDPALRTLLREYTYEAGVRNLDREIANLCRKIARRIVGDESYQKHITPDLIERMLGPAPYLESRIEKDDRVGVVNGLSWGEGGGDVLEIEVVLLPGKGNLTLTGSLGEMLEESAQAALSYARSRAKELSIKDALFEKSDIHVHLPEAGIPKDGPSAGITIALGLISALTGRKVRGTVAMTGEITLRGRVLPIGGIKEKILAAHRAGLRTVIFPQRNAKDLIEIPKTTLRQMHLIPVTTMDEVVERALLPLEAKPRAPRKPKSTLQKPLTAVIVGEEAVGEALVTVPAKAPRRSRIKAGTPLVT